MISTKTPIAASLLATLALLVGCVTAGMPENSQPVHFYYAAVADYTAAKKIALKYAVDPLTPRGHVAKVLEVIDETDPNLHAFEMIRRGKCEHPKALEYLPELAAVCRLTAVDHINAATGLRLAAASLRRLAVKEEVF